MPENSSPFDDPFADLYGKLPDPQRARAEEPPASRRAAREARENAEQDAPTPPAPSDAPSAPIAAPRAAASASEEPAVTRILPQQSSARPAAEQPITRPAAEQPITRPAAPIAASTGGGRTSAPRTAHGRSAGGPSRARSGTLEDLFTGERSADEIGAPPPPPNKRRRRIAGWVAFGIVLALIGGVAAGGLWVWNTYEDRIRAFMGWEEPSEFEAGMANGEAQISIVGGDAGPQVAQKLYDAGVTKTPTALYDYMIVNNIAFTFQPGIYKLQLQMTSEAVLAALGNAENRLENTARLPEGLTVQQSIARVSEQMAIPLEDLQAAVADPAQYGVPSDSLEGWLFPATYTFDPGTSATDVVRTMVNRAVQSLDTAGVPEADRQRILTIASIIQREARSTEDFYKVSRVIENRLQPGNQETFGLLQMDSTAQYGYGEMHDGSVSSSEAALTDDNPWNTYVNAGLPIGPIANPGDLAIDAAMKPVDGPWYYFVTVNLDTGETVFSTTAAEHEAARQQWIQWCRDNPDSGC